MKKNTFIYIITGILSALIVFNFYYKHSYCAASGSIIGTALYNSFNIASEYYAARAGRNIVDSTQLSTDITGVSGISDGTSSEEYSKIFSGNADYTINYIMNNIRDVDVSELSASEKAQLASIMAANNSAPYAYKAFTLGGITLYYAVDELGNWIGNSYDNIVCKFQSMTADKTTTTQDSIDSLYGNAPGVLYGNDIQINLNQNGNLMGFAQYQCSSNIYCYTTTNAGYNYFLVIPASEYTGRGGNNNIYRFNGTTTTYNSSHTQTATYNYIDIGTSYTAPTSFFINGVEYYTGAVYGGSRWSNFAIGSLDEVKTLIASIDSSGEVPYYSELIDSSGVPYVVPDLDGFGATIGDIYPVIEELREAILTIPGADSIASGLSGTISDSIEDLIDAIKSLAITLPDVIADDEPVGPIIDFTGTVVPDGFPANITEPILDLFDFNFNLFSFFEPLFYIFGTFTGIYALWTVIPLIIIIMVVIWALK